MTTAGITGVQDGDSAGVGMPDGDGMDGMVLDGDLAGAGMDGMALDGDLAGVGMQAGVGTQAGDGVIHGLVEVFMVITMDLTEVIEVIMAEIDMLPIMVEETLMLQEVETELTTIQDIIQDLAVLHILGIDKDIQIAEEYQQTEAEAEVLATQTVPTIQGPDPLLQAEVALTGILALLQEQEVALQVEAEDILLAPLPEAEGLQVIRGEVHLVVAGIHVLAEDHHQEAVAVEAVAEEEAEDKPKPDNYQLTFSNIFLTLMIFCNSKV